MGPLQAIFQGAFSVMTFLCKTGENVSIFSMKNFRWMDGRGWQNARVRKFSFSQTFSGVFRSGPRNVNAAWALVWDEGWREMSRRIFISPLVVPAWWKIVAALIVCNRNFREHESWIMVKTEMMYIFPFITASLKTETKWESMPSWKVGRKFRDILFCGFGISLSLPLSLIKFSCRA